MRLSAGRRGRAMKEVHIAVGVAAIAVNAAAASLGPWGGGRVAASTWFWKLWRAGQAGIGLEAALGGVLVLMGRKVTDLHLLYGLLPLAISFVGEQLRIASAEGVLARRGF